MKDKETSIYSSLLDRNVIFPNDYLIMKLNIKKGGKEYNNSEVFIHVKPTILNSNLKDLYLNKIPYLPISNLIYRLPLDYDKYNLIFHGFNDEEKNKYETIDQEFNGNIILFNNLIPNECDILDNSLIYVQYSAFNKKYNTSISAKFIGQDYYNYIYYYCYVQKPL